jgi:hypothetical protein
MAMKAIQLCLFGPDWEEDITFHPEKQSVGEECLKNRKKGGSKRKIAEAQAEAQQLVLPLEDERLMEEALPS